MNNITTPEAFEYRDKFPDWFFLNIHPKIGHTDLVFLQDLWNLAHSKEEKEALMSRYNFSEEDYHYWQIGFSSQQSKLVTERYSSVVINHTLEEAKKILREQTKCLNHAFPYPLSDETIAKLCGIIQKRFITTLEEEELLDDGFIFRKNDLGNFLNAKKVHHTRAEQKPLSSKKTKKAEHLPHIPPTSSQDASSGIVRMTPRGVVRFFPVPSVSKSQSVDFTLWFDPKLLSQVVLRTLQQALENGYMSLEDINILKNSCKLPAESIRSFLVGRGVFEGKPTKEQRRRRMG